ncbi:MAG: restriction endonuclease [Myxococcales bacterium]|nr:restriction endonuclease [Myxococcales bacterium]
MALVADDLPTLESAEFEGLVFQLLTAMGFVFDRTAVREAPFDFAGNDASGRSVVVECRLFRRGVNGIGLREAHQSLARARAFVSADVGYLVVNQRVPPQRREQLTSETPWLIVVDADDIISQVGHHPALAARWLRLVEARRDVLQADPGAAAAPGASIIAELAVLPSGKSSSRTFEETAVRAINHALCPPLDTPRVQSRSDDGLDVRDAVYPIFVGNAFWDWVRAATNSWFVVVECKNFAEAPGQTEVESLQQYLYSHAMRSFGILVSRRPASEAALKARRRSWLEFRKLIVLFSDAELNDMVRERDSGGRPERLIELHLFDFFATLTP